MKRVDLNMNIPTYIRHRSSVVFQTMTVITFLLAVFCAGKAARAQDKLPLLQMAGDAAPPDTAEIQRQRLIDSVAQAIISLEANGDRTMDAIENFQVTLTLGSMQDSSRLAVLCNNGGKSLNVFVQSLAGRLPLNGKVNEAACGGVGRDDDPFVIKFHLHYESGETSLFYENPPAQPFIVESQWKMGRRAIPVQWIVQSLRQT